MNVELPVLVHEQSLDHALAVGIRPRAGICCHGVDAFQTHVVRLARSSAPYRQAQTPLVAFNQVSQTGRGQALAPP